MSDPAKDRYWNGERWVWPDDVADAVNAAQVAIHSYYNEYSDDYAAAVKWLLKAHEANQEKR